MQHNWFYFLVVSLGMAVLGLRKPPVHRGPDGSFRQNGPSWHRLGFTNGCLRRWQAHLTAHVFMGQKPS
jgi:hypothetical protein